MDDFVAPDGLPRCGWAAVSPEELAYHDTEWGFPVREDVRLFEKVSLEGFQAGLSWRTILNKRENFRAAFDGFDIAAIAEYGDDEVARLLGDAGIVRHRGKIEAVINNAGRAIEMQREFGSLAAYFWGFEVPPGEVPTPLSVSVCPSSIALSKDLRARGWKFVGPTTAFAFMQAMGLINDHSPGCIVRPVVAQARSAFAAPTRTAP